MKKRFLVWGVLLLIGLMLTTYFMDKVTNPYIKSGKTQEFEIYIGSKFKFRLDVNGSTGYANCWLNEKDCKTLRLNERSYRSSWAEITGSNGAGGTETWSFNALKSGTDTLVIAKCPTGRDQKDCSEYTEGHDPITIVVKVLNR